MAFAASALLATFLVAPSVHAIDHQLEFSLDGIRWSRTPPASLFDEDMALVPGSTASATLHLRSTAATSGVLDVALTDVWSTDAETARAFGISSTVESAVLGARPGLSRTRVADLADLTPAAPSITLKPGQSAAYTLSIDIASQLTGTDARRGAVGMSIALRFQDDQAVSGGADGDGDTGRGGPAPGDERIPLVPASGTTSRQAAGEETLGQATAVTEQRPDHSAGRPRGLLALTGFDARTLLLIGVTATTGGALLLRVRTAKETS